MSPELSIASPERSIEEINRTLVGLRPRQVEAFKPDNDAVEKKRFQAGEIDCPDHHYPYLDTFDFAITYGKIDAAMRGIDGHRGMSSRNKALLLEQLSYNRRTYDMMRLAHELKSPSLTPEARAVAEREYMQANREVYGEPNEITYLNLVAEKKASLLARDLTPPQQQARDRLFRILPEVPRDLPSRFRPKQETIDFVEQAAHGLFDTLVRHITPSKNGKDYPPEEIEEIFSTIIAREFDVEAMDGSRIESGWKVELCKANTISVLPSVDGNRVEIPRDRKHATPEGLRDLVVHELGIHLMRSLTGSTTDLMPMEFGFPHYLDAEEGMATIFGKAINGNFEFAGSPHYLASGLATFGHKNYAEVEQAMAALDELEGTKLAWSRTRRCFSGTDYLPRYKSLSYFHGNETMWKYLESICGDEQQLALALSGKFDPSNLAHMRAALEAASKN